MYTWILVFLLCSWKIETLILKLKDQKLQTMQLEEKDFFKSIWSIYFLFIYLFICLIFE